MAIKLDVYLKRTQQTLESWLRDNNITHPSEFQPRCAYLGLAASNVDVALAEQILKKPVIVKLDVEQAPLVEKSKAKRRQKDGDAG